MAVAGLEAEAEAEVVTSVVVVIVVVTEVLVAEWSPAKLSNETD